MKKFWTLVRVGFQSMLLSTSNVGVGNRKRKRRARTALGVAALLTGVWLYVSGTYSWLLMKVLAPIQMESLLFMFMGVAAAFSGLLFTAFAVKTTVYGGSDNDLLLSMPVSSTTLMLSRVASIYLESLLFAFAMLVPAGVACAALSTAGAGRSVGFWLRLLAVVAVLPMLDTALSLLVGAALAWLSHRVTKSNIGQTLVMGVFLTVVFWFAFNMPSLIEGLAMSAARVRTAMAWLKPAVWMADGIMGSWTDVLRFALACAAPFALAVGLLGRNFLRAVTAFANQSARSDYRLSEQRSAGQVKALLGKEARRFFGSSLYFWNGGLGLLVLVVGSAVLLVRRSAVAQFLPLLPDGTLPALIAMAAVGFCLSMVIVAAPSFSLEGRSLWVLREAPVATRTLIGVKTGFQLMLALPCVLIASACLALSGLLTPFQCLLVLLFGLVFEIGHATFGTLMGLRFPKLDAPNDAAVIKNSLLSFISIFAPMAILALAGVLGWLLSRIIPGWTAVRGVMIAVLCADALFALVCAALLARRGEALFDALGEQA